MVVTPAVSGPYDLGNVVVRAALARRPDHRPGHRGLRPAAADPRGDPAADRARSRSTSTARTSPSTRPTATPSRSTRRSSATKARRATSAATSRSPTAPASPSRRSSPSSSPAPPSRLATRPSPPPSPPSPAKPTSPAPRSPCPAPSFSTTPTSGPSAPASSSTKARPAGEKCPPGSILGFAKADTPLLDKPLEGPVYLRASGRAGLPDIVAALNGQIDIVLDGHIDSVHGRLRTTFEAVPDAPVTKFILSFYGGNKGLIENSPQLCAHAQHFTAAITGQKRRVGTGRPEIQAAPASALRQEGA